MNIKAIIQTAKILSLATIISTATVLIIQNTPVEYIALGLILFPIVMISRLVYQNEKDKIETLEKLNGKK
jgi:hypothetical protein